ncbi:MAG: beta strand repeat-containing protein [Limisphaerales bacterium]
MKKLYLSLLTATYFAAQTGFSASVPTFDPYADASSSGGTTYTYPGFLSHQTNAMGDQWYSINTGTANANSNLNTSVVLTNIGLFYPGLTPSTGNAIVVPSGTTGMGARMFLTNGPSPISAINYSYGTNANVTVYYSLILQVPVITSLSTTGDFCFGFNNQQTIADQSNNPGNWCAKVWFRKNGTGYNLGISKMGSTVATQVTWDSALRSVTDTNFIVVGYTINPGNVTTDDVVKMWINPNSSTFGNAAAQPTATITGSQSADLDQNNGGIDNFQIGVRSASQPNLLIIDDFRMGTDWGQVTGGPLVKSLPALGSVIFGSNIVLNAGGGGNGLAATYQWQRNGANLSDGGNVIGSQTKTLTIAGATANNAGSYTFVVGNSYGTATSSTEVLAVTGDPRIITQPTDQTGPPNSTVVFGLSAVGTPTLTYQWLQNGNPVSNGTAGSGMVISGATTASLTLAQIKLPDSGSVFSCNVGNGVANTVVSSNATLTVQDPAITTQPQSVTTNYQGTANFNVSALGSGTLTYRWQLNGSNLADGPASTGSGATVSGSGITALTIAGATYLDQGSYTCVVKNGNNVSASTSVATLTVNDPYIVTQPTAASVLTGGTGNLSVAASGTPSLTYQWYKGANALVDGATANGSTISGSTTATLTISTAATGDSGTYSVQVTGPSAQIAISSNVVFTAVAPASITSVFPVTRTQRVGDHMAFVVTSSGTGPFTYIWSHNGAPYTTVTTSALSLTNLQLASAGTYTVTISNAAGTGPSANVTLNVSTNFMTLSSNNLVVTRMGDGSQSLNNTTGNTIYMDQFQTDGTYVNTIMVPDAPTSAFGNQSIAGVNIGQNVMLSGLGSGTDAFYENVLTRSANQQYLNFAAYNVGIPAPASPINSASDIRGIGAVNAVGFYQLAYTNAGLYSGGNIFIRSVVSDDGLLDFWTTGAASSPGIKYVQVGVSSYAGGSGVPALAGSNPGTRVVDIAGGNVVYSDSQGNIGLNAFSGLPKPSSGAVASGFILNQAGSPNDFAISPDLQTIYIADDRAYDGTQAGGIQRWDTNSGSGGFSYTYTISPGAGTNGALCLTVDWSASATWGPGVNGAIIYATTVGTANSLVRIVDTGAGSSASVLTAAGPKQILRGVRFGPVAAPVQITSQPQGQTNFVGQTVSMSVGVTGDAPFSYQWQKNGGNISGATNSSFTISNAQLSDSGSYTVTVSDPLPSSALSSVAVVNIAAVPPTLIIPLQSRVETAGDHMAFSVLVAGSAPFTYAWTHNGFPISATGSTLALNNIQSIDAGTYMVTINNPNGQATSTATLTVTPGLQQLAQTNVVVVRLGDGAQPLSSATGNTIYLDQYSPNGTYVNTIMLPDTLPSALIAAGGSPDALTESFMTMSHNGSFLNIGGFNVAQPYTGTGSVGFGSGNNGTIRGFGAIDSYGYFSLTLTNVSLYNAGTQFRCVVSDDGLSQFWTTGVASSVAGMKYVHNGGATTAIAGGLSGTRVVDISPHGNVAFTDVGDSGMTGLNTVLGLPTGLATPTLNIDVGPTASPNDFSVSPDVSTVYIADDENFSSSAGYGGIERWDYNGSTYSFSYTLATGGNSLGGARSIVVDYSGSGSWGAGVNGAVIYATTTEGATNRIVRIVDNGPGSTGTVLATAGPNQLFRGMRFGPAPAGVSILGQPVGQTLGVGGTATFTVSAGGGPFTYQWQLNGVNLTDGPSPSGSGAVISGSTSQVLTASHVGIADSGENYSVVVSNPTPGNSANSNPASLTVLYSQFGPGNEISIQPDQTVQLNFSGSAGSTYRIWGSTNVALKPVTSTWTLLTSGTFTGGADSFVDTNAPTRSLQFYTITIP